MWRVSARLVVAMVLLTFASCGDSRRFYPVRGKVFVDGQPAEGVTIVFHTPQDTDPPLKPSAIVAADGSFELKSWLVEERVLKEGAPSGEYKVTCVWYPPNLDKHLASATLPDKLHGKYSDRNNSQLSAEVPEAPIELPAFQLTTKKD